MNTLTGLIPSLYERLDVVSRELTGLIPSVSSSMSAERAAVGQAIVSPVAPASEAADISAGQQPPNTGDQVIGSKTLSITKARAVPVRWTGEEEKGMNSGAGFSQTLADQFEQAFRTLTNEVESDLAALSLQACRAAGTAGTTPFATAGDFSDAADVLKILKDNGAPADASLVMNTTHGAKYLGKQSRADIQGSDSFMRQGVFSTQTGLNLRESGQLGADHVKGTASGATTDNAGYAVGATELTLASAGTGTILAGDVFTLAGDPNQYVALTGDADVSGGGTVTIPAPGLQVAITTSATAISVAADFDYSLCLTRNAIALATRMPARPSSGDSANDVMAVTDPRSGLTFEISVYGEYRQVHYEVALAWGAVVEKNEHMSLLIG